MDTYEHIDYRDVPELSTSGVRVSECQVCGALVYERTDTRYKWQPINHGQETHYNWHQSRGM